jgi:micrococcal nuclease
MYSRKTFLLFWSFLLFPSLCLAWQGKVVGVTDGHTITVMHDGRGEVIRLYGVYCPEKEQDFSRKAKQFTSEMVSGKTVEVKPMGKDHYGRTLGMVFDDGRSLNEELVKAGLAWVYTRTCKERVCTQWSQMQLDAGKNKVGLWSMPKPTAPWEFRRGERSAQAEPQGTPRSKQKGKKAPLFHGDTVSHVFHASGCEEYDCDTCIVPFKTREQALRAGYKACGVCSP